MRGLEGRGRASMSSLRTLVSLRAVAHFDDMLGHSFWGVIGRLISVEEAGLTFRLSGRS